MTNDDRPPDSADTNPTPWWSGGSDDPWRPSGAVSSAYRTDAGSEPGSASAGVTQETRPFGAPVYTADTIGQQARARRSRDWLVLPAVALATALIGGGVGAAVGVRAARDDRGAGLRDGSASLGAQPARTSDVRPAGSVAAIAQAVLPSVVSISVRAGSQGDSGTGVIIRSEGYILTNNHVIAPAADGAGEISVQFNNSKSAAAAIVGRDPKSDLAVIKVQGASGLSAARLGSSANLVVGDPVVAIGSPLGLNQTVTSGIVSAKDRPVAAGQGSGGGSVIDAIQTDAAINPGNSGGPLVNNRGEVVGINSAIATLGASGGEQSGSIGLGFAIPIDQARSIAEEIIRTGRATHPVLGISARTLTEAAATSIQGAEPGALVQDPTSESGARLGPGVTPGGPADKAGIKVGDIIVAVDGQRVTGVDELVVETRKHRIGDTISVTYIRAGKKSTVRLTLVSDASLGS